jgi:5'(3')-deoxyribonucleotidase
MGEAVSKPVVLIDCDGVLADFVGQLQAHVKHYLDITVDLRSYDQWDTFSHPAFADCKEDVEGILDKAGFCLSMDVLPGAQDAMKELVAKYDVHIVTSPWTSNPRWEWERRQWLSQHFGIHWKKIISTHAKAQVHGDVFIDDKPMHVNGWQAKWRYGLSILWEQAYNQKDELHRDAHRYHDWDSLLGAVKDWLE